MIKLKQSITNSIIEYPSLYKDINYDYSRQKVLNQLFFTNGNGLEWENGELIDPFEIVTDHVIPKDYFSSTITSEEKDERCALKDLRKRLNLKFTETEECNKYPTTIYPICDLCTAMNLPNDIKPDWLDGAQEAVDLAVDYFKDPYKHCEDHYIQKWIDKRNYIAIKKYVKKQLGYLTEIQKRITELKLDK